MGVPKKKSGGKKKPARAPQQVCTPHGHKCMRPPHAAPPPLIAQWMLTLAPQLTAEEHYENAEMAFAMENLDLARTSFKRALELEPEVGADGAAADLRCCGRLPPARLLHVLPASPCACNQQLLAGCALPHKPGRSVLHSSVHACVLGGGWRDANHGEQSLMRASSPQPDYNLYTR